MVNNHQQRRLELLKGIEKEFSRNKDLGSTYSDMFSEFQKAKKAAIQADSTDYSSLTSELKRQKHIYSRLHGKINEVKADVKAKRDKINDVRKNRVILDGVYSKIESEMCKKIKELLDIVEKAEEQKKKKLELIVGMSEIKEKAANKKEEVSRRNRN